MNSPCCDDQPNTVAPGGAFAMCVSSWGVYDLHGNLHEWIATKAASGNGIFKGGFFVDAKINGAGCTYATTAHADLSRLLDRLPLLRRSALTQQRRSP